MRLFIFTVLCGTILSAATPHAARAQAPSEYEVKAAFLYNFAAFVEWPEAPTTGAVRIGIVSVDPPPELARVLRGRSVAGRDIQVLVFAVGEEIVPTDILFITADAATRLDAIAKQLKGHPVLIVGESDSFARSGGMVNFYVENSRVRFEINRNAAESVGLRMSSQLLRVARLVAGGEE